MANRCVRQQGFLRNQDKPHSAKANKEAATGTEWNEAAAREDGSQGGNIFVAKKKKECFPSLTSANFIHVPLFPFILKPVHIKMYENQTGHLRSRGALFNYF